MNAALSIIGSIAGLIAILAIVYGLRRLDDRVHELEKWVRAARIEAERYYSPKK